MGNAKLTVCVTENGSAFPLCAPQAHLKRFNLLKKIVHLWAETKEKEFQFQRKHSSLKILSELDEAIAWNSVA